MTAPRPPLYDPIAGAVRLLLGAFFKRIEVTGIEHIPDDHGGLLISWHPNGLIDPALLMAFFPHPVIFGARHGLFRWPGLGWLMRGVGTVPIFRAKDAGDLSPDERRAANTRSLDALAQTVADGGWSCLFPEGDSHDNPDLIELKTGAARFWYRARQLRPPGSPPPVIVPVGLHYDAKRRFRSRALITFHPPLRLPPELNLTPPEDEAPEVASARAHRLTTELMGALQEAVHVSESWEQHFLVHRARKLLRAERAARAQVELRQPSMIERELGFERIWAGRQRWQATDPQGLQAAMKRLAEYDADLRALDIEDEELDRTPRRGRLVRASILAAQVIAVYLLLPALLVLGGVVNVLPYLLIRYSSRWTARLRKDEATIKLLLGVLLYPAAWATAAWLALRGAEWLHALYPLIPSRPVLAASMVVLLAISGGMVALRYVRLLRETARALRVRLTRARQKVSIARLKVERAELTDAFLALEAGLDLPGSVTADGEVIASEVVPPGGQA